MTTKFKQSRINILLSIIIIFIINSQNVFSEINNGELDLTRRLQTSNLTSDLQIDIDDIKKINLKINDNNNNERTTKNNYSNLIRLQNYLDVFNIEEIANSWSIISNDLSPNCSQDMVDYFKGLQNGRIWAVKMDDATGHYTSGFFYGNNYWMGSLSSCESIYKPGRTAPQQNQKQLKTLPFPNKHSLGYTPISHGNPPFLPGFYVVKVLINETALFPSTRTIHLGICLPSTCSLVDVRKLTTSSQKPVANREITILDIRSPTDKSYDMWKDKSFIILMFFSTIVFILLVTGTLYDIYLTHRFQQALNESNKELTNSETSSGIGCTGSEYSDSSRHDIKKDLSVVIQLPHNTNNSDENLAGSAIHEPEKITVYSELLLSFSIITNFNAICDRSVGSDTIPSIHGLRAFSMAWVILGHTCIVVFKYSDNMELRKVVEKNFLFQAITNGPFSVDTFFFISGFLVSYIYFRTNAKGNLKKLTKNVNEITAGTLHFFGLVGYRFVRLTAPYLFVLGVVEVTMKYLETHSVFDPPTMDHVNCPKYWWRNVLYINTLFPVEDMCMLWSWYLANDTQFYIIGAIMLIIGVRHFKLAATTMAIFLVSSWITTGIIAFSNNHMPNTDDPLALFDKIYDKPWTRLGPYLIGMAVGWVLFKTNCKVRMNRCTVIFGWTVTLACLLLLIFGLYNAELSLLTAAAYSSLSHSAWALALAWITIACSTGHGGYINSILSAPCIYPFSRVTYCAYLVHPIVIRSLALNSDAPLHLGTDSMVITFFGLVVCSYILSFVVSLSFEAPVVTMLKIMSPNRKKRLA